MTKIYSSDKDVCSMDTLDAPVVSDTSDTKEAPTFAPMYWVIMHNDPITTMDFVVETLVGIFGFDNNRAFETMYAIHTKGLAQIAVLPLERAEMKVAGIHQSARSQGFPLTCTIEPDTHSERAGA